MMSDEETARRAMYVRSEYSLCTDCPIQDECGTSKMPGQVISCGKRCRAEVA